MSKDLFDQILAAIKESPDDVPTSVLSTIRTKDPELEFGVDRFCKSNDILKVMDSSIFYEGGLRGKLRPGNTSTYRKYPIADLAYFIVKATMLINTPELEEMHKDSIYNFDPVIEQVENLKYVALFYRSLANYKKLEHIKQELINIKSSLLNKPNPSKLGFRIDHFSRFMSSDRIDLLIDLFEVQVLEAPRPFTIGRAIHRLLSLFSITSTEAAITQRIYRKRLRK